MKRLNSRHTYRDKYGLLEYNGYLIVCILDTGVFMHSELISQLAQTPKNTPKLSIGEVWKIRSALRLFDYTEATCRRETDRWISMGHALKMDTKDMESL